MTGLTDAERRYAYRPFSVNDEDGGRCYIESDVERIVAAREAAAREEERAEWADYLERWTAAVGPEPPTVDAVIRLLRADRKPFGVAAGGAS